MQPLQPARGFHRYLRALAVLHCNSGIGLQLRYCAATVVLRCTCNVAWFHLRLRHTTPAVTRPQLGGGGGCGAIFFTAVTAAAAADSIGSSTVTSASASVAGAHVRYCGALGGVALDGGAAVQRRYCAAIRRNHTAIWQYCAAMAIMRCNRDGTLPPARQVGARTRAARTCATHVRECTCTVHVRGRHLPARLVGVSVCLPHPSPVRVSLSESSLSESSLSESSLSPTPSPAWIEPGAGAAEREGNTHATCESGNALPAPFRPAPPPCPLPPPASAPSLPPAMCV